MAVRLSKSAWIEIKRLSMAGHGTARLAQRFGISIAAICNRSSRERWTDDRLTEAIEPAQDNITELAAAIRQLATSMAIQNRVEAA
jgi:hypothetical protein